MNNRRKICTAAVMVTLLCAAQHTWAAPPALRTVTFDKPVADWPTANNDNMTLSFIDGAYRIENKSGAPITLNDDFKQDVAQPYAVEAELRVSGGGVAALLIHYEAGDQPFVGMSLGGGMARPVQHVGGGRLANAGAYGKAAKATGTWVKLRIDARPWRDERSRPAQNLVELTFSVDGAVIGKDERADPFATPTAGLQLSGKGRMEVRRFAVYGAAKVEAKAPELRLAASFAAAKSGKVAQRFTIGEPIYGVVDLGKPLAETFPNAVSVDVREVVRLDGNELGAYEYRMSPSDVAGQGSSYEVAFSPTDTAKPPFPGQASALMSALLAAPAGKHELELSIVAHYVKSGEMIGLGKATVQFDASDAKGRAKLQKAAAAAKETFLAKVQMPPAAKKDKALEQGVVKAIKAAGWKQKVRKVVIMQADWGMLRHETFGTVLQRMINVAVGVEMQDGSCMIFFPTVFQKHTGGGKFSSETTLGGNHGVERPIACKNLR